MANSVETSRGFEHSPTDSVDWLRTGALCALCLDGMTTGYVLATDSYRELNPILADLWTIHPAVVTAYFLCFIYVVQVATRRRGWLSTTISAAVVVVMGGFGGLNNLMLILFGSPSLLDLLSAGVGLAATTLVVFVLPACGLGAALVTARARHGRLPWRGVVAVVAGGGLGYLVYLRTAQLVLGVPTIPL